MKLIVESNFKEDCAYKIFAVTKNNIRRRIFIKNCIQRAGIAAGGIFYNVQPGTAAQLKFKVEVNNKMPN